MKYKKGFTPHLLVGDKVNYSSSDRKGEGFTLIELLIVIGIIAILAAIVFVAVDPARRLAEARNAERWSSVNATLNGILKYTVDNAGSLPAVVNAAAITAGEYHIIGTNGVTGCDSGCTAQTTQADCVDLTSALVDQYLSSIPLDPSTGSAATTGYYVSRSTNGRFTIGACDPEDVGGSTPTISVSR